MTALPRALCGPLRAMARPSRPAAEVAAVRDAVAAIATETGAAGDGALAGILAARVVAELRAYLNEDSDAFLAAVGEIKRRSFPTAVTTLATDPDIDTVSLFVEARVARLRARSGAIITAASDKAEYETIMSELTMRLQGRYLRHLRA